MSNTTNATSPNASPSSGETINRPQKSNMGLYAVIVVLILVVAGIGVYAFVLNKPAKTTTTTPNACVPFSGQTIQAAGSSFVAPLVDQWETSYTTNTVNYQSVGSGTGISDLTALSVDAAYSDAPMSSTQLAALPSGQTVLTMPESIGGPAVIYNLPGTWHAPLNLTATVLANIFQGTVTMWNDPSIQSLNPSDALPASQIIVVHRSDGSGTSYVFQQFLQWDSAGAWNLNYSTTWLGPSTIPGEIAAKGSSGVTGAVKSTPDSISYVDLEYALTNGVTFAAVENVAGHFIVPSISDIQSAIADKTSEAGFALPAGNDPTAWQGVNMLNAPGSGDYPISTFTYTLFYQNPQSAFGSSSTVMTQAIAESLANYLNWSVSANGGQQYSTTLYYVPLAAAVTAADQATIEMMQWNGAAIPPCQAGTGPSGYQY